MAFRPINLHDTIRLCVIVNDIRVDTYISPTVGKSLTPEDVGGHAYYVASELCRGRRWNLGGGSKFYREEVIRKEIYGNHSA